MVGKEEKRVMDDFGNIIYILAAIGWFFWNAYRKVQKEKEPGQETERSSRRDSSDKDGPFRSLEEMILDQMEGGRNAPEPVSVPSEVKEPMTHVNQDKFLSVDLDHSHLPDDYQMSKSEGGSHRVKRQVERLRIKEPEIEESVLENLFPEDGFDLRKAVVLNAILERPYN